MNSSEATNLLDKHIRAALSATEFPPQPMARLDEAIVTRTIDRIDTDDRLKRLFAHSDGDAIRRTFLSVYYQVLSLAT